jgi:hypothetical protein
MKKLLIIGLVLIGLGFTQQKLVTYKFKYPKKKNVELKIDIPKEWKISKEKRGEADLYFTNITKNNGNQILFSVLFFKLNDEEKESVEELALNDPIVPFAFFLDKSRTVKMESKVKTWHNEDFYFKDSNIEDFNGIKAHQKNINAYCMYGYDLFVKIHISKLNYSPADSIKMMKILNTIVK